jgi:hypothetical protein
LGANKEAMLFAAAGLNLEKKEFSEKATWRNEEHCVLVCLASIVKSDGAGGMNGMNERMNELLGLGDVEQTRREQKIIWKGRLGLTTKMTLNKYCIYFLENGEIPGTWILMNYKIAHTTKI